MSYKRWKKGYKVVLRRWNKLVSVICCNDISLRQYKINVITERESKSGPLCVFNNFKDADEYCCSYDYEEIYECKYKESVDKKIWYHCHISNAHYCEVPGKVLADKVILTKKINRRKMRKELRTKKEKSL